MLDRFELTVGDYNFIGLRKYKKIDHIQLRSTNIRSYSILNVQHKLWKMQEKMLKSMNASKKKSN